MGKTTTFQCSNCKRSKAATQFIPSAKRPNSKLKRTKNCKTCRMSIAKCLLSGPKSKTATCRRWWDDWRRNNPCIDCGETNVHVLSADHRLHSNKVRKLSDTRYWGTHGGAAAMQKEISKCVSRCIICHRIRTRKDKQVHLGKPNVLTRSYIRYRFIRNDLTDYVNNIKCTIGECFHCKRRVTPNNACGFDFDHLVSGTKQKNVSDWVVNARSMNRTKDIDKEIERCVLLCANCHQLKTRELLDLGYIRPINLKQMQEQQQEVTDETFRHDRFLSLKDQNINEPEQRSPEWFQRRRGKLSGSKLSQFLFIKTQEERIKFAEEVFEGRKRDPFTPEQQGWCKWGSEHEDIALGVLLNNVPNMIAMEAPMVQHSSVQWLASSPDGFYHLTDDLGNSYEQGCIEIKCPAKRKKCNVKPTYYYVPQMYLEMACSGNDKVIFCSWGPKMCRAWKLEFDNELWDLLCQLMSDLKKTKTPDALSFEQWSIVQYRLKTACHNACNKAKSIHAADGWACEEA